MIEPRVAVARDGHPNQLAIYSLAEYRTVFGTAYVQYVHSSLVNNQSAARCTYTEFFKPWKISQRELDGRLRRAIKLTG